MSLQLIEINEPFHSFSKDLYETAFPPEERLEFDSLFLRDFTLYKMKLISEKNQPVGIFFYWEFEAFDYIEHFAVSPLYREKGLGGTFLTAYRTEHSKAIVLEAEKPDTPLAVRRISFYNRMGFKVLPWEYIQPPYEKGKPELPMHLLSNTQISYTEFEEIKKTLYTTVYRINSSNF